MLIKLDAIYRFCFQFPTLFSLQHFSEGKNESSEKKNPCDNLFKHSSLIVPSSSSSSTQQSIYTKITHIESLQKNLNGSNGLREVERKEKSICFLLDFNVPLIAHFLM
jgi:hypothetical protein